MKKGLILTAVVLLVFATVLVGCASAPKQPKDIVYDSNLSEDQTASLYIEPGYLDVYGFDGEALNPRWFQVSTASPGMLVKIPSGEHEILFNYYGGAYGVNIEKVQLKINPVAGRTYRLFPIIVESSTDRIAGTVKDTLLFATYELMFTRAIEFPDSFATMTIPQKEPEPNEQRLFVQLVKSSDSMFGALYVLDKGTPEERTLYFSSFSDDVYVNVPKGDHTIDVALTPYHTANHREASIEPEGTPQRNFTVADEPVRYAVSLKNSGSGKNRKTAYTLTQK